MHSRSLHGLRNVALFLPLGLAPILALPQSTWKAPSRYKKRVNPTPNDKGTLRVGRKIYRKECLSCHGASGKGDGKAASGLEVKPGDLTDAKRLLSQTDGELYYKIRSGKRPMPTYRTDLSPEQIWSVVRYIRKFTAGAKGSLIPKWFRGKAPKLDKKMLGSLTVAVDKWLLTVHAAQTGYANKTKAWEKGFGSIDGARAAISAAVSKAALPKRATAELKSWDSEIAKSLPLVSKKGAIQLDRLSKLHLLTASLLERYAIHCDQTWALYHFEDKAKKIRIDWLQPRAAKPIVLMKGLRPDRTTISKVFPTPLKEVHKK